MPDQLILGQSARLGCDFDLEQSRLYSVNWYKDGKEFFRFMPSMENKVQVFPVDGVNVDVRFPCLKVRVKVLMEFSIQKLGSNSSQVKLYPVVLDSGGVYRCEVSNESPDFDTVTGASILSVVGEEISSCTVETQTNLVPPVIPSGPRILPRPPVSASPGDFLRLNCSLNGSLPVPRLQWYINKTPASSTFLTVRNNSDTTIDTVLSLALNLHQDHFSVSFTN